MKNAHLIGHVIGLAGLLLCGHAMAAGTTPVPAKKPAAPRLEIYMPGDDRLDCSGIGKEIARMEDMIIRSDAAQQSAENTGTGISIAKAIGGFLIGSIPGAIGVMAAGHVASEAAEGQAEDAEAVEDVAEQRRSMMIGMYNAKTCKGPIHSNRSIRNAAISEDWDGQPRSAGQSAMPAYGNPEDVRRFDPAAIEPAAGGRGYRVEAHKVGYND